MPCLLIIILIILLGWLFLRSSPRAGNGRDYNSGCYVNQKKKMRKEKLPSSGFLTSLSSSDKIASSTAEVSTVTDFFGEINNMKVIKADKPIAIKPFEDKKPIRITRSKTILVKPQTVTTLKIVPSKTILVKPPKRGAWDERGWIKQMTGKTETYTGFFQVRNRKYQGRIEIGRWTKGIRMYIHNPPPEVKNHEHGACFQLVKDGWFVLHWSTPARNVDDAIFYMEKVLDESLPKR